MAFWAVWGGFVRAANFWLDDTSGEMRKAKRVRDLKGPLTPCILAFFSGRKYLCALLLTMIMKKIVFFLSLVAISLTCRNMNAQTPYLGGSLTAAYNNYFKLDSHFLGGYEFNDKWAVGGGIGLDLTAYDGAVAAGFLAVYVRYTPWHNDVLFTDIKWRTETLIGNGASIDGADIGLCGSLRFRVNEHIDIFTDFLPLGVRYSGGDFYPLIGILCDGCSLGLHYRF